MTDKPFDYYEAPSDEIFEDIKDRAIAIWNTYNDQYGYASEKIARIKDIKNVKDNAWYIVAMFDTDNQRLLVSRLQAPAQQAVTEMLRWSYLQSISV